MGKVRVNYNGYQVEFLDMTQVGDFIASKLNSDLSPRIVVDVVRGNTQVIVYEYFYSLYQEVFVITLSCS